MTTTLGREPTDLIDQVGRHWGWVLAYGILTLLAGIAVLAWPSETLLVIAVLFGVQLIISGIFRFVGALASDDLTGGTRVMLALLGVLSIIIGLWAVRHAVLTLVALIVFLGIFWVINGLIEIFAALSHRDMPDRGWSVLMGVLSAIAGIIVLAYPGLTLVGLAVILGIWLLVFGILEIVAAFRLRRLVDTGVAHPAGA
ncbi:MAG TPA: HdeD family acid-resistance protein [Trebonia sp.]